MICIRIFPTYEEAKRAKALLVKAGITATVSEDKFGTKTLSQSGFPSRFRLFIRKDDFEKALEFMATEIKKEKAYQ